MEGSQKHKVVCFIEGWAVYRKEPMKFSTSKDLDPFACTHLIYAFATLDPHNFVIVPQDEDYDIVKGGYRSVLGMKRVNPSLKILISIGGWVEGTRKFSQMAGSAYNRREFIRSVLQFLDMYDFDGLDLDWEYPGAEDLGGRRTDKEHFSLLVEELSEVFAPRGWLLSASVSPSRFRLEDGYDVPRLNKHLDFINIMTFDLHAERDSAADHHSPLVQRKHDVGLNVFYNVDYAVRYWMKKGASREKIIVGIPFYGRSFSLVNASMSWPSAPVKGFGLEGKYTQEQGFLAYFEVLELMEDNHWRKETDDVGSPYIVKGDQWIGYDNPDSIATKNLLTQSGLNSKLAPYNRSVAFTTLSSVCMNLRMSTVSCFSLGEAQSEADSKPQSLSSVRYKSCRDVFVVWSLVETSQMEAEGYTTFYPIARQMSYIRKNMLGGAMIWAIDLDDFHGLYGEKWPLLSVVKNALLVETKPEQLPGPVLNPPVPVVIPPVAGSPVSVEKGVMNCTGQGFVRDSNDCAVYYRCEWAMKHTYICPEGLFYDSQLTLCNWPELTDCPLQAAIMEQTTLVPPVMVSTAGSVAVLCQSNGMFEDSYDCRGYYVCQDGQPQRYTCSLGQSFNPSTGLCHYGTSPRCATQVKTRQYYEDEFIGEEDYKVMCYFTNWAWYRKGEGKFVPEHLDSRLCTHIVYAYASLDPNDLVIKPFDPWADIDNNFYQRITGTGRPGAGAVNVLLALGGWTDSSGDKYSRLVSNGSARRKFVTSVVAYLRRHNFRGLQLDWTYPKCWQSNCGKGPSSDKPNFTKLVQASSYWK
uniref:Chitinase n=1 Tax=Timema tahoe TaxID=61484 RepID=A0A7R9IFQ4_9NEOP|nr:unnamed protein product [Timema tahoe]